MGGGETVAGLTALTLLFLIVILLCPFRACHLVMLVSSNAIDR